jgi:hypothetical protein
MAYDEVQGSGKDVTQAGEILLHIIPGKDYSRQELKRLTGFEINAICGRVNELLKSGVLEEGEIRSCEVTGRSIRPVRRKTQ